MRINGHMIDEELSRFLSSAPSFRLVAIKCTEKCDSDVNVLDLGLELSDKIASLCRDNYFSIRVEDALDDLVRIHTAKIENLGKVIVFSNLGIMFEPKLGIDFTGFLKKISRNTLTILLWPGEMNINKLSFLTATSKYFISQSEINYTII